MERLLVVILLLVGTANLLPLAGVLSAARVEALYAVRLEGADMTVLMRHRAVLLGIVGALLIASAFRPDWRTAAMAAGFVSMLSFVALALAEGGYNANLRTVLRVDVAASALLAVGAYLHVTR